jgi:hypothetical protein
MPSEGPGSLSNNLLLNLNDPSIGYFPNIEESYLSQGFVGDPGMEGLKTSFPAALPLLPMSKLQQQNTAPVASTPSFDIQTPPLSSIDANFVSFLSVEGSSVGQNVLSILYLPRSSRLYLLTLPY